MTTLAAELSSRNKSLDVTGWLNFDGTCFYQCLEGEASVIDQLYREILLDTRHHDVVTLTNKTIDSRHFEGWSMQLTERGDAEETMDALTREELARPDGAGVEDLVTNLNLRDMVVLGGAQTTVPSLPISKAVEAAGRRWQTLRYKTFVKHLSGRRFTGITELAATIVENVLVANRRGPAVLPNLKAFLMRRADLTYYEIGKACRNLQAAVYGRGDALDGLGVTEMIAAVTAVTFSVRALNELDPAGLKKPEVRRILVNLCRAALDNDTVDATPLSGLKGNQNWIAALIT
jgi:hypothetical protein